MQGELFGPEIAKKIGYAIQLSDEPLNDAIEFAKSFARKPGNGVGATRVMAGQDLIEAMKKADSLYMDDFLDSWFSEIAQNALQNQAERLSGKKAQ